MGNANYCAFYVSEPFSPSALGAHATRDFVYYNLIRKWSAEDASFPFFDAHSTTYSVRDDSDWEKTLKPRLRQRLSNSKNLLLIISSLTKNSRALREEVDYGVNSLGLPLVIAYPEMKTTAEIQSNGRLSSAVQRLWDNIPILRDSMHAVPRLHIPFTRDSVKSGLSDKSFMLQTKTVAGNYHLG